MIYLSYFVFGFAVLQLIVALTNLVFRQKKPESTDAHALVSVLIPARNEAQNISQVIGDLQKQPHQNIEIVVFDDQSDDETATIVQSLATEDDRIRLIQSNGLPDGWLGKNHACHKLAASAKGDFLLFIDADVRLSGNQIADTVGTLNEEKAALLSLFPMQQMETTGEEITVPLMNFILLTLLPLPLVKISKRSSLAAANGQFMLFDPHVYRKYQPHQALRKSKVEDIEIARLLKKNGEKIICQTADENLACRMYNGFRESCDGFAKNILMFFGNSIAATLLFFIITSFGWISVLLFSSSSLVFMLYLAIIVLTRVVVSVISRQSVLKNVLWIVPQQFAFGLIVAKAINRTFKNQHQWKGRSI